MTDPERSESAIKNGPATMAGSIPMRRHAIGTTPPRNAAHAIAVITATPTATPRPGDVPYSRKLAVNHVAVPQSRPMIAPTHHSVRKTLHSRSGSTSPVAKPRTKIVDD